MKPRAVATFSAWGNLVPCRAATLAGGWRRLAALLWITLTLASPATGAARSEGAATDSRQVLHAFTLRHQPAAEAIALVFPLLSEKGAVELQRGENTLVIRDDPASVRRIIVLLTEFDHPASRMRLGIQLVQAGLAGGDGAGDRALPPALVKRLRELLRYRSYSLLAAARLTVQEGEDVVYQLSDEYEVRFRMGTLMADRRLKLHGFRIAQRSSRPDSLIHTNLNLWLNKPMILGLAKEEASERALMVVLTCTLEPGPSP